MLHALTKVDHSTATVMCVLGVADAIGRAAGGGLAASRVLPLCCPLTFAPGLNRRQLATALGVIRGMLDRIETERMPRLPAPPPSPAPTRDRRGGMGTRPSPVGRIPSGRRGADPFAASGLGDKVPPERERHARRDERRRTTARAPPGFAAATRARRISSPRRCPLPTTLRVFSPRRGSSAAERGSPG